MAGFGANLKAARKRKRMTQTALAESVGVDGNTLARWERSELVPSDPAQLILVAQLLGTSVEALFDEEGPSADDVSYRAGLHAAARRLRELVEELEQGGPDIDARSVKAGQHSRKRVGLKGVEKVNKKVDRPLKIRGRPKLDSLPEE